jgi:hypothetical protein
MPQQNPASQDPMPRTRDEAPATIDLIAVAIGATLATAFVGFLAWKVGALPLQIIVVICIFLMIYALYEDVRAPKQN